MEKGKDYDMDIWVSSPHITCVVLLKNHIVVGGAPIAFKFKGRPFMTLLTAWGVDEFYVWRNGSYGGY